PLLDGDAPPPAGLRLAYATTDEGRTTRVFALDPPPPRSGARPPGLGFMGDGSEAPEKDLDRAPGARHPRPRPRTAGGLSRLSDRDGRAHPGMDHALVPVDARRQAGQRPAPARRQRGGRQHRAAVGRRRAGQPEGLVERATQPAPNWATGVNVWV